MQPCSTLLWTTRVLLLHLWLLIPDFSRPPNNVVQYFAIIIIIILIIILI